MIVVRASLLLTAVLVAANVVRGDAKIEDFSLQDSLGATHSLSDWSDSRAVVVVFLGTKCPLAKLYGPRLAELATEFQPKGVQFVGIDANQQDSLLEIAHYVRVHKIDFPVLKDVAGKVAEFDVTLRYRPVGDTSAVTAVYLAGSFYGGKEKGQRMDDPDADGYFHATLRLKPGQYEYKFVINGTNWTHDPENPDQNGPFTNSVIRVRPPAKD